MNSFKQLSHLLISWEEFVNIFQIKLYLEGMSWNANLWGDFSN